MNIYQIEVKQHVNEIDMHKNDSVMTCTIVIMYVVNMLKNINLSNNLFTEFESKLFQNKELYFSYFFRKYIEKTVENIHYPVLMN